MSGRMGTPACLESVGMMGMETLGTGAGLLPPSSKCFSSAFPQLLVYFKKNNIKSYKMLVNL